MLACIYIFCIYGPRYCHNGFVTHFKLFLDKFKLFFLKIGKILSGKPGSFGEGLLQQSRLIRRGGDQCRREQDEEKNCFFHGGNPYLYDVAVSHADKTMKCQFRPDYTSYHVAVYDTITGNLIKGVTHQGYADSTMWARGQAWAIYGYTVVYRETKDPKYLDFAQKVTDVYLERLPEDKVPYWDFSAPGIPDAPRDASAAACTASALYELSTYIPGKNYKETADKIMENLGSPAYRAEVGTNGNFILMHSVGSIPHGAEVDVPLNYADYYFLEGIMRKRDLESNKKLF